ncbi:hypothetical protein AYI69_g3452 [Smittium culicis]|uniref:Uncharacterized protein n=1 Tax=Smittium culicis TaxID=133412 RepID=A0A1R1YJR5_9FUNG|nr:hypothetical protein AYI69_g3452 [Smittium culicis]
MASCRNFDTVNTISKSSAPICIVLGCPPEFPPRSSGIAKLAYTGGTLNSNQRLPILTLISLRNTHQNFQPVVKDPLQASGPVSKHS